MNEDVDAYEITFRINGLGPHAQYKIEKWAEKISSGIDDRERNNFLNDSARVESVKIRVDPKIFNIGWE